jgi:hypothetical protein
VASFIVPGLTTLRKRISESHDTIMKETVVVSGQNPATARNLIHVICYTATLYVIDFKCALNSGQAPA